MNPLTRFDNLRRNVCQSFKILYMFHIRLQGTDQSFVDKLNIHFGGNSYFGKSPHAKSCKFTISHYAGKVSK
jgi:hypothetical protein